MLHLKSVPELENLSLRSLGFQLIDGAGGVCYTLEFYSGFTKL